MGLKALRRRSFTPWANELRAGLGRNFLQVGDVNTDGKSDLLLQHSDGSMRIWLMDGSAITADVTPVGPNTVWTATAAVDVDADGKGDLAWQHTDGSSGPWLMKNTKGWARVQYGRRDDARDPV